MDYYLILVFLLFLLAISDLVVGVSNDAVNFLNSAIGSKVAPRHVIMIVASVGIILGATFSSGMMEVARKGIFNPALFSFAEVMVVFLAVMLTDIILLDLFNTFGLPTSTTVSIIFELLGASVLVAIIKVAGSGEGLGALAQYINSANALTIISGIFLSVAFAFTFGTLMQYFSRLLFTFRYHRRMRLIGSLWSGLALATMSYFLIIKGIKGASFVSDDFIGWVQQHTLLLLVYTFTGWTIIMYGLVRFFRVNILRLVVLFGTFALAMAFAGNDLVNFIGVPIAGFESFQIWKGSGLPAEAFDMTTLNQAVRTKTFLLLGAGLIMTLTLWLSRKARTVTETEVNLGRQREGLERFSPNLLSRSIVRYSRWIGTGLQGVIPKSWLEKAENSFEAPGDDQQAHGKRAGDPPAFDLVRASVNLTVASALIALATSYKLPLSTTYVSFMVAMGTSLSDRAWGRDSAVFRVAGVLNVIGGWFATAFIAFTCSALFALLIYFFGGWAVAGLVLLAVFLIARSFMLHRQAEKKKEKRLSFQRKMERIAASGIISTTSVSIAGTIRRLSGLYRAALDGLLTENRDLLQQAGQAINQLKTENEEFKYKFFGDLRRIEEKNFEASRVYLLVYDLEQDILQSAGFIVDACASHVENVHSPLKSDQTRQLQQVTQLLEGYLFRISLMLEEEDYSSFQEVLRQKKHLHALLEEQLAHQVGGIKNRTYGALNSLLFFSLLLETKDIVAVAARFVKLYHRLYNQSPGMPLMVAESQ